MSKEFKNVKISTLKTKQYITKDICREIKSDKVRKV